MSHTKKKTKVSRKKLGVLAPKDYTVLGDHHEFMNVTPAHHGRKAAHPISHRVEKWVLLTLLAIASAAFMGFKLLENSDMTFSISDAGPSSSSGNSLATDSEFRAAFKENRTAARALLKPVVAQKSTKVSVKKAIAHSKKTKITVAKKSNKRKKGRKIVKVLKKSSVAKR